MPTIQVTSAFISDETHTPECADGIDNDGDGWTDTIDPVCLSANTLFEDDGAGTTYQCNDGLDNDGDGVIDAEDLDVTMDSTLMNKTQAQSAMTV